MIEPRYSFAQLQNTSLPRVEIIGIIGGIICDEINPNEYEILGSIYENPELIKDNK